MDTVGIDPDWFWACVDRDHAGCWLWSKGKNNYGYGYFYAKDGNGVRRQYAAHRVALALSGVEVGPKHVVCHKCDIPACVRPSHLFAGTQKDNLHDMERKGRARWRGSSNGYARLIEDEVRCIRVLYATGRYSQERLGDMFDVARGTIKNITSGVQWKHVA